VISLLNFHKGSVQYELEVNACLWTLEVAAVKLLIIVQVQRMSCEFLLQLLCFIVKDKFSD
jgi:hypothetical protein